MTHRQCRQFGEGEVSVFACQIVVRSCYLLAPYGTSDFVTLDAGTLPTGLLRAGRRGSLSDIEVPRTSNLTREDYVRRDRIKAYLISHAQ